MAAGPLLNCEDLPETKLVAGCFPQSRRRAYRTYRRVKDIGLPVLAEGIDSDEDCDPEENESHSQTWACRACTFENHASLTACEVCAKSRNVQLTASHPVDLAPVASADDWPELQDVNDGWMGCEVSSVGSSWLEVGYVDDYTEEGGEDSITLVKENSVSISKVTPLSWSARVGVFAPNIGASKIPASGTVMPPLSRRQTHADENKAPRHDDEEDPNLMELEARRMHSQPSRGVTQRRREANGKHRR